MKILNSAGFFHRIKQDVAAIFEESIKRGLDQWKVEVASTGKSAGKGQNAFTDGDERKMNWRSSLYS